MMNENMNSALNSQINAELYSSYLYLSMGAYFDSRGLRGHAHWMRRQASEEKSHAMKLYDYVVKSGNRVRMAAIDAPQDEWPSTVAVFENVLAHEKKVTGLILELVALSEREGDQVTRDFLQWFVHEQEEEEESAEGVLKKAKSASDSSSVAELDAELSQR
jgi:ferritin